MAISYMKEGAVDPPPARRPMKNPLIAKVFNEIADLLELKGENAFRIRAYRRAALNVEGMAKDLASLSEETPSTPPRF